MYIFVYACAYIRTYTSSCTHYWYARCGGLQNVCSRAAVDPANSEPNRPRQSTQPAWTRQKHTHTHNKLAPTHTHARNATQHADQEPLTYDARSVGRASISGNCAGICSTFIYGVNTLYTFRLVRSGFVEDANPYKMIRIAQRPLSTSVGPPAKIWWTRLNSNWCICRQKNNPSA